MAQRAGKRAARTTEMRRKALDLRIAGLPYDRIAQALGCSKAQAHRYVTAALEETRNRVAEQVEQVREMELQRIDAIVVSLWQKRGDPRVADTLLRAGERRSKLLGLDAPERSEVTDKRSSIIAQAIADAHPELAEIVFGAAVAGRVVGRVASTVAGQAVAVAAAGPVVSGAVQTALPFAAPSPNAAPQTSEPDAD